MLRSLSTGLAFTTLIAVSLTLCAGCGGPEASDDPRAEAQAFLDSYVETYVPLYYEANKAEWASNTRIVDGDDTNRKRTEAANAELAAFTGSVSNIETARALLERQDALDELQVRQLEQVLYAAAGNPQTVPELVARRILCCSTRIRLSIFAIAAAYTV